MASNKFVIKCGNFAVLVDVHILPEGSSKDTSWFSDHEKESVWELEKFPIENECKTCFKCLWTFPQVSVTMVCTLLEEVVASRVKHYLEAPKQRGQWKSVEHTPSGPMFLTDEVQDSWPVFGRQCFGEHQEVHRFANGFHITAYFMKRWINLRCAVGKHYRDLRVFPEKFIVCVTRLESNPSAWTCENGVLNFFSTLVPNLSYDPVQYFAKLEENLIATEKRFQILGTPEIEELSNGTSEYFTESAENKKLKISLNEQIKQDILKEIVKRTKTKQSSTSKPQTSKGSTNVYLGSADSQTGTGKSDCRTSLHPQPEVKCRSVGQQKGCINTAESNLELPVLELENDVNQKQPADVSSQQKPHSAERFKSSLLSENPPCSCESALLGPKQSQQATQTQAQQKSCGSEEKLEHLKNASSDGAPLIPSNPEMNKRDDGCLGSFLEEKTPLNSRCFSKDTTKILPDKESLTLGKNLSQPLSVRNDIVQTHKIEPNVTTEELPVMPLSCLEPQPVSLERLTQKRKKEAENGLRKLKLRRLKKS